jgi:drug/metabolite transporter (DMT)-like permease
MTSTNLALLLGVIALLSAGQVLFKYAASSLVPGDPRAWLSWTLLIALAVYAVATVGWVLVLSRLPLSVAFPFYGLAFVIVPVLARVFLHEPLRWQALAGGALILAGIAVSTRGLAK